MAFVPSIKKRITMELFKLSKTEQYFKILGAMKQGEEVKNSNKQPPILIEVMNLETAAIGQIIAPKILESELNKHYANDAYVGKCFALSVTPPVEGGKKYNLVNITEIEDPTPAPAAAEPKDTAAEPAAKGGKK